MINKLAKISWNIFTLGAGWLTEAANAILCKNICISFPNTSKVLCSFYMIRGVWKMMKYDSKVYLTQMGQKKSVLIGVFVQDVLASCFYFFVISLFWFLVFFVFIISSFWFLVKQSLLWWVWLTHSTHVYLNSEKENKTFFELKLKNFQQGCLIHASVT